MQLAVIDTATGRVVRTVTAAPKSLALGEVIINPKTQRYDVAQRRIFPLATPVPAIRTLIAQLDARLKAVEDALKNQK